MPFFIEFAQQKNEKKPSISFWQYWSGSEAKPIEELVKKFNSENHEFKVEMLQISMPRKKILMSVVANVAADLVHLDGDMVVDFALRNALSDLNAYIQEEGSTEFRSRFIPIYLKMLNIQGKQWALPLMPNSEALHINKNLLAKYQLTEPESLEDIVQAFDIIHKSNPDFAETAFLPSWPPWIGRFIVVAFGGNWAQTVCLNAEKGKCSKFKNIITANDPKNIRAWKWIEENFVYKIPAKQLAAFTENFSAYQSPDNPFYSGKIVLENNGVWEKHLAKTFAPEMEIGIKAFPSDFAMQRDCKGNCPASLVSVDALAIPRNAKHPQMAFKFMQWLLKKENLEYLARAQHKFTPLKEYSEDFIEQHPNAQIKTFIDLAKSSNAQFFPQLNCVQKYRREIKNAYDSMLRREKDAETALNDLQDLMQTCE